MGEMKVRNVVLGITRQAPGFIDEHFQARRIREAHQSNPGTDLKLLQIAEEPEPACELLDLREQIWNSGAHLILAWKMEVFAPFIRNSEEFLSFIALLEDLNIELQLIESDLLVGKDHPLPYRIALSLWQLMRINRKRENASASRAKAMAKGRPLGPKPKVDAHKIHLLRREGLSIRAIADRVGISPAAVQRGLLKPDKIT
jgi:hypothetical protein